MTPGASPTDVAAAWAEVATGSQSPRQRMLLTLFAETLYRHRLQLAAIGEALVTKGVLTTKEWKRLVADVEAASPVAAEPAARAEYGPLVRALGGAKHDPHDA